MSDLLADAVKKRVKSFGLHVERGIFDDFAVVFHCDALSVIPYALGSLGGVLGHSRGGGAALRGAVGAGCPAAARG